MTEPFFFSRGRGLSVREIAALARAKPRPGADLDRRITGIAALDQAAPSDRLPPTDRCTPDLPSRFSPSSR